MIRRLYVDNFRSLVDFTWEPGKETLVLGYNGSGKTSALEVIQIIQDICAGRDRLDLLIHPGDRTSWLTQPKTIFEIEIQVEDWLYAYHLEIGFGSDQEWPSIVYETMHLVGENRRLFVRDGQVAQLSPGPHSEGPPFPINAHLSLVSIVGNGFGGEAILPFRDYLRRILYLKPIPFFMGSLQSSSVREPEAAMTYLIPWYVHLAKNPAFVTSFFEYLKNVWPELVSVQTPERTPDVRDLVFSIRQEAGRKEDTELSFSMLSDGEKVIVGLYVVAAYQKTHLPATIIIDEPDNFVSLLELQPWLLAMLDTCPEDGQLILISHNEEIIQTMGRENVAYFARRDHVSPTTVRGISAEETDVAPLRDLLRRGWLDE